MSAMICFYKEKWEKRTEQVGQMSKKKEKGSREEGIKRSERQGVEPTGPVEEQDREEVQL
jgi:hypothetical protein